MHRISSVLMAICLLLRQGYADLIDQQCVENYTRWETCIEFAEPIGQSFVPSFASHTAVDLWITVANSSYPVSPLTVRVREGDIAGPILADSTVTPPESVDGWVGFPLTFNATPGNEYVIEADATNYRWGLRGWNVSVVNDVYPQGQEYLEGQPNARGDLNFRTWVVPEPTMPLLLALGGLAVMRRRSG